MKHKFFLFIFFIIFMFKCYAQDSSKSERIFEEYMKVLAFEKFSFEKPDDEFELLEDSTGYQSVARKAVIKYVILPGSYAKALKDFKELDNTNEAIIIDTITQHFRDYQVFTIVQENFAPVGTNFENHILVYTIIPLTDYVTIGVVGSYPKSSDRTLRQPIIQASLTIRKQ